MPFGGQSSWDPLHVCKKGYRVHQVISAFRRAVLVGPFPPSTLFSTAPVVISAFRRAVLVGPAAGLSSRAPTPRSHQCLSAGSPRGTGRAGNLSTLTPCHQCLSAGSPRGTRDCNHQTKVMGWIVISAFRRAVLVGPQAHQRGPTRADVVISAFRRAVLVGRIRSPRHRSRIRRVISAFRRAVLVGPGDVWGSRSCVYECHQCLSAGSPRGTGRAKKIALTMGRHQCLSAGSPRGTDRAWRESN